MKTGCSASISNTAAVSSRLARVDREIERRRMVDEQLRRRGIIDPRVLEAFLTLPRELFVDASHSAEAYSDAPVGIGFGQTLSQPYITALMAQVLGLEGHETVLEVGAGSGFAAAVLGKLAKRVIAIELLPELCARAQVNLDAAAVGGNVTLICGDGSVGYPAAAPFDAISVAAAAPEIPSALMEQLNDPGRLVIPVGTWDEQDLLVIEKHEAKVSTRRSTGCRFVPLRGEKGWH
jgi:protein-L-isoaspartate(D-aspartate) O-methyltransferase